jgi:hypothetical protein
MQKLKGRITKVWLSFISIASLKKWYQLIYQLLSLLFEISPTLFSYDSKKRNSISNFIPPNYQ